MLCAVGDSARYDVFQVAEAAAAGDARRSMHILLGLKNEGAEPTLVLWALPRELRGGAIHHGHRVVAAAGQALGDHRSDLARPDDDDVVHGASPD